MIPNTYIGSLKKKAYIDSYSEYYAKGYNNLYHDTYADFGYINEHYDSGWMKLPKTQPKMKNIDVVILQVLDKKKVKL